MLLDDDRNNLGSDGQDLDPYTAQTQLPVDEDYRLEDDSYPSRNEDKFYDQDYQFDKGYKEELKAHAKRSALQNLKKKFLDKPLDSAGSQVLGVKNANLDDHEKLKELAKQKAREKVSQEIGKRIGNEAVKAGFEKGLSKGAGAVAKDVVREAGKKVAGQVGKQVAAKGAAMAVTDTVAVGAAPETLGLSLLAGLLLNIAISLGVGEAIDCLLALKNKDLKEARFHALKAVALVQTFIWLLVTAILCLSVAGMVIGVFILLALNIYTIFGLFYKETAWLQGMSRKWMMAILVFLDCFTIGLIITFLAGILFGVCNDPIIGNLIGWSQGSVGSAIVRAVDWATGAGGSLSFLNEACSNLK